MTYTVATDHPVALHSPDHREPYGTANDNSRHDGFRDKLLARVPGLTLLDVGCSGGGFVKSVVEAGGEAIGLEGSDYSLLRRRAEWATIPERLFTCDVTEPFRVERGGAPALFSVVTAWEFLEHLAEDQIPRFLANVDRHLAPGGLLIGSVSVVPCGPYHLTVRPKAWWLELFAVHGLVEQAEARDYFGDDWLRLDCAPTSFYTVWGRAGEANPFRPTPAAP